MIYISEQLVSNLLTWTKTYQAIEVAMRRVSEGRVDQRPRNFTHVLNTKNILLTMSGYLRDDNFGGLGSKMVTVFPENASLEKPLPSINANIMLLDETTGILKAVVAGTEITAWRTAAASAVATRYLFMNKPKPYKILTILGSGVQGRSHAEAFKYFFNFQKIRLWNRTSEKARKLVQELNKKYNTDIFEFFDTNEDAVRGADVIVTATNAASPIVKYEWVKNGVHINAVGAGLNHHSELDEKLYRNSSIFIDHWEGAKNELSGLEKMGIKFQGEIGSVITGDLKLTDASDTITIFQSLGMAVEDCAMARLTYDLYTAQSKS